MSHLDRCSRCGRIFTAKRYGEKMCARCSVLGNNPQPFPPEVPSL